MFGDVLRRKINQLSSCSLKKTDDDAFWVILRNKAPTINVRCLERA